MDIYGPLLLPECLRCRLLLEAYKGTLLSADDTPIKVYRQVETNIQLGNKLMRMVLVA